jgi:DNA-3-methyladenine glycosylase
MHKLPLSFYLQEDVVDVGRQLLGKFLYTDLRGEGLTGGMIVETEAYAGAIDKASHAHGNKRTKRTEVMYSEGGVAYIYLIYGFYNLFNVITNYAGTPHAILIRAIEPIDGVDIMLKRRKLEKVSSRLTAGPGLLSQALGITREENGASLLEDQVWIEERGIKLKKKDIIESPRVNIGYAEEHIDLPWRFRIKENIWVSKAK